MALTNAERQKKYRERMQKENPTKYAEIKAKNAERNKKRKNIKECCQKTAELKRQQWKASQKRHRAKKKDSVDNHENYNNTDHEGDGPEIDATRRMAAKRKKITRKWANQKKNYEDKIKAMTTEMNSLKRKCKRYMQKNKKMIKLLDELKSKTSALHIANVVTQNEAELHVANVVTQNENEMTPLSKSNSFIQQNLPHISEEEKEQVKRQLLTHNVLVNAIQDTYSKTEKNDERNVLKKILENKVVKKYNKKCELTTSVFGLRGRARQIKTKIRKNNIIINEIYNFYNKDDVSRATAGKNECKTKSKIKKQRRYLLNTLKELYKKYRADGGRAKRTMFIKYKPFYVLPPKLSDRETCGCVKHENFSLKIKKLHSLGMIKTTDIKEIISEVICDFGSKECAYRECSACNDKFVKFNGDTRDMNEIVTWNEYAMDRHEYISKKDGKTVNTKKMVKKEISGQLKSLTESFNEELKVMKKHVFNIVHQYSQYLSCVNNLKLTEVAIHIDFSENYVCKLATEVQSMHFGASKAQITIHTGVLYVKGHEPQSFASISPSNEHGPEAIWAHLKPLLDYVRKECPLVNAVHFFSDGPATQYKQKKNFYFFTNYTKDLGFPHSTWNFSESAHGKGAADGVGGGLKRRLDGFVKHGVDVPDAYTAYTLLKNSDTTVMTFYIQDADIAEYSVEENLTPVPQTMNIHQITNTEIANVLRYRCLSCFCGDSHRGYCGCFNIKTHQLVKTIGDHNNVNLSKEPHIKRKKSEDDETAQVKKRQKVTILSEVRYRAENMIFNNILQNREPVRLQSLQTLDKDFNLFSTNKENIDYDNPTPSTSGTGKTLKKQTTIKKKRPGLSNSDYSSTDEDIQYSVHDSSGDFNEEFLSDTEEETYRNLKKMAEEKEKDDYIEENDDYSFQNTSTSGNLENKNKNANDGETMTCNLENKDNYSRLNMCTADVKDNEYESKEAKEEPYNIDDSVIVRYYLRNKWKYYIGFVEEIDNKDNDSLYTIRFLKTINKPTLKFITTKKVDRDVVPINCIVKIVQLLFDTKDKEYVLKCDDDCTYF